ncbi:SusC/RagA family TonB-linked outer membrane protein [Sphingobacterium paludis]|uniref:TonB-linked SusC/RagA family outer membrane protein n=1 Tax=Sphingobacterium paludis TaxID=1476465 RepID=A0A4R7D2Z8_9SPHI|nr:TonB-dependent receptor [Sphingobacterium paludis]TDS13964.1 TonB-linked SusC/RagA family outer membrane protein [Sphingobacterium paludis]
MKQKLFSILFVLTSLLGVSFAQNREVTGKVTSAKDGTPISGVSITVAGTSSATQTGPDGQYSISAPPRGTLSFSYIGYIAQRIAIAEQTVVNVELVDDQASLEEVLVTGYGTTTRLRSTGSASVVEAKDVEQTPFPSVDRALQGKVPGLQSTGSSGQPGSMQQVRIRGVGSISGSSSPLYVIDGIPINAGDLSRATPTANVLASLNPNDIENMTVLKDAASTAIYGSRGANGVILITTKSGKAGKTKIRLDADFGSVRPGVYNDRTRPLTTEENILLLGEALLNNPTVVMNNSLSPENIREYAINNFGIDPNINTNWYDEVTRTGNQQQYNLSVDGGNEKTIFNIGGGYFKQQGTIPNSDFTRYSGKVSLKHDVNDRLTVGTSAILSTANLRGLLNGGAFGNPVLSSFFLMPNLPARNPDGSNYIEGALSPGSGLYNPLEILERDRRSNNTQKALTTVYAEYKILPNLKLSSKYGIDYTNIEEDYYNSPTYGDGRNVGGRSYRDYTRYFNWVWTNLIEYKWDIDSNKDWIANIKAGYEAQKSQSYTSSVAVQNVPLNTFYTVPSVGATPVTAEGTQDDYAFASFLALGDISYRNKYVVSGSYRNDGSSRFGVDNRFGNFWSVAGSWNMEQEDFIKDISSISSLKLRASYGVTGNAGIGNNAWRTLYGYTRTEYNFVYDGAIGSGPTQYGLRNLTWERTNAFDLGLDVSLFDNRLNATVDYYNRQSEGLLYEVPVPYSTGFDDYTANFAGLRNRGVEFSLSGTPLRTDNFQWNLNFNIALNRNTTTRLLADEQVENPYIRKVGEDYFSYYLPQWAGADPENGDPLWYVDETRTETTNVYGNAQRVLLGKSALPKAFGSFGTTLTYKGIGLDAMFYYNFGNHIYQNFYQYQNSGGAYYGSFNQNALELDRWQNPGDITDVPRPVFGGNRNSFGASDRLLREGDFIRLRDLTLSYTLSPQWIEYTKLSSVRLYFRGSNLWTWVKDDKLPFDPEAGSSDVAGGTQGVTNFDVFIPKTFTFGINVGF